ncbi:MAG: hypothetical protein ACI8P3_002466 [Saprospiraceae bacterium]|jgi:hypothetical protein
MKSFYPIPKRCFFAIVLSFFLLHSSFAQLRDYQNVVTKCYTGPALSVNNTMGTIVGNVNFASGIDIPVGHKVVDVIVEVVWSKSTVESCSDVAGAIDLGEVGFKIQGPTGGSRYLAASAATGGFASPPTSASFSGNTNVLNDTIVFRHEFPSLLPATLPVAGRDTVSANSEELDFYWGYEPYGDWSLLAIDDAPVGPNLCINQYCITLITCAFSELYAGCKANPTIALDAYGVHTFEFSDLDSLSDVSCITSAITFSPANVNCSNIGTPVVVTMTIRDHLDSVSSCVSMVNLIDATPPLMLCQNINTYLDGSGNSSISVGDIDNGSWDNCGMGSLSLSKTAFTCADAGANSVTLSAVDYSGNSNTCNSTVTVLDTVSPIALCQNLTIFLDGSGNASINASELNGGSSDNCSTTSFSASKTTFTCADTGVNNVTLTVDDGNGNSSNCVGLVTVMDTIYCLCPDPSWSVPTATSSSITSDASCLDSFGWTHYINSSSDEILLSLKIGSSGAVVPYNAVTLDPDGATDVFWVPGVAGNFVTNTDGAGFMKRKWDVAPTTQPTSPVGVRFYYSTEEYDAVNTEISNHAGTPLVAHTEMRFFKVLNGSDPFNIGSLLAADGIDLGHGTASTTEWTYSAFGSDHYAEFYVDGFSGGGGGGASGGAALPIELLYIRGEAQEKRNKITWASATENNTQYHLIERSINGFDNWTAIGRMDAAGFSLATIHYEFFDESPATIAYYRLKTIDFDEAMQVSQVVLIERGNNVFKVLSVYPIPTKNELYINFNLDSSSPVVLTLIDLLGQIIISKNYEAGSGTNRLSFDLSTFNAGLYFLRIDNGREQLLRRIVKQ